MGTDTDQQNAPHCHEHWGVFKGLPDFVCPVPKEKIAIPGIGWRFQQGQGAVPCSVRNTEKLQRLTAAMPYMPADSASRLMSISPM